MNQLSRTEVKILLQCGGFAMRALCAALIGGYKPGHEVYNHLRLMSEAIDNILSDKFKEERNGQDD